MSLRHYATVGFEMLAIVVVVSLVVGAVLGQPVLLSYVETGSMEPTIATGDGFIAIPAAVAGDVQEGDVVVFEARNIQGGGMTTHRVVGETDRGYVTKGDANPFTDQDSDEPPVTEDQIVAKALQIGSTVVVIPRLGVAVEAVQNAMVGVQSSVAGLLGIEALLGPRGVGFTLFGLGAVLFAGTLAADVLGGPERERTRSYRRSAVVDTRTVTLILLAAVLVPATAAMVLPGGIQQVEIDGDAVAENDAVDPEGTVTWEYEVHNAGYVPLLFVIEPHSDGATVPRERFTVWPGERERVVVEVDAPPPGERRVAGVVEHRYLLVAPPGLLVALHEWSPLAPIAVVNGLLGGAIVGAVSRYVGIGRVRIRDRESSLATRVRRWLG